LRIWFSSQKGIEAQADEDISIVFIGQLSVEIEPSEQEAVSQSLMARLGCTPVFLSATVKDRFYKGMLVRTCLTMRLGRSRF
jgi:hypothetical protein